MLGLGLGLGLGLRLRLEQSCDFLFKDSAHSCTPYIANSGNLIPTVCVCVCVCLGNNIILFMFRPSHE